MAVVVLYVDAPLPLVRAALGAISGISGCQHTYFKYRSSLFSLGDVDQGRAFSLKYKKRQTPRNGLEILATLETEGLGEWICRFCSCNCDSLYQWINRLDGQ